MQTIDQVMRQPTQSGNSTKLSSNREAVEAFMRDFPTSANLDFFTAQNWPVALKYTEQMLTRPSIPLADLDEAYNTDGLALQIVTGQFVGLHQISGSREPAPKSAHLAAQMFVAKYGQACSLFDMMIYFANYPLEYKTTFAMFDVQDILAQYARKYLIWKRNQRQEQPEQPEQQASNGPVGYEGFLVFAAEHTPEYLRQSHLYRIGFSQMIEEAIKESTSSEPF